MKGSSIKQLSVLLAAEMLLISAFSFLPYPSRNYPKFSEPYTFQIAYLRFLFEEPAIMESQEDFKEKKTPFAIDVRSVAFQGASTLSEVLKHSGLRLGEDSFVHWEKTNRKHPRNWTPSVKLYNTIVILLLEFITYVSMSLRCFSSLPELMFRCSSAAATAGVSISDEGIIYFD